MCLVNVWCVTLPSVELIIETCLPHAGDERKCHRIRISSVRPGNAKCCIESAPFAYICVSSGN